MNCRGKAVVMMQAHTSLPQISSGICTCSSEPSWPPCPCTPPHLHDAIPVTLQHQSVEGLILTPPVLTPFKCSPTQSTFHREGQELENWDEFMMSADHDVSRLFHNFDVRIQTLFLWCNVESQTYFMKVNMVHFEFMLTLNVLSWKEIMPYQIFLWCFLILLLEAGGFLVLKVWRD